MKNEYSDFVKKDYELLLQDFNNPNGISQFRLKQAFADGKLCECKSCFCCYVFSHYKGNV